MKKKGVGIAHEPEEETLSAAYDFAAEKYALTRGTDTGISGCQNRDVEQPIMLSLVPRALRGTKLLDVGCGPGIHAAEYVLRGATVSGIDISSEMILIAKKRCPVGDFQTGSVSGLNFSDDMFDMVTASLVFDHVKNLSEAVLEVKRVLRSKGVFIFSVPHPITYMFRSSESCKFIPSNAYFDNTTVYYNIANAGNIFPGFPRTLQEYFKTFLECGFSLMNFVESLPPANWLKKYPDFDTNLTKIPLFAFFVWQCNK